MSEENKYILEVKDLHTSFFTDAGEVKAVNGISFNLEPGKTLGIVGESGSGKSVTAYSIMQILAETGKITGGEDSTVRILPNGTASRCRSSAEKNVPSFSRIR